MIGIDAVNKSLVYFVSSFMPSGVRVVEGQTYGVNLTDPSGKPPMIGVTVDDLNTYDSELGSYGYEYNVVFTVNALSAKQRNALNTLLVSGLMNTKPRLYTTFSGTVPIGSDVGAIEIADHVRIKDMPNFDTDRERFFWISTAYCRFEQI